MPVVTRYTAGYPNPTPQAGFGQQVQSPHEAMALVREMFAEITVVSGDSIASIYKLGRIPSNAIIIPGSSIYTTAITGLTSVSVGFTDVPAGGTTTLDTALMSAVDMHLGGAFDAMSNVTVDKYNYRAWKLLGLTADPSSMLDVEAKLGAAPSAGGSLVAHIRYTVPGL